MHVAQPQIAASARLDRDVSGNVSRREERSKGSTWIGASAKAKFMAMASHGCLELAEVD
jgi:hypothetical protein